MKIGMFTDIHWGAKGNSIQHNDDCVEYMQWFIQNVKREKCEAVVFMGDWFENRNAINVQTLNKSYDGLRMLDDLGLPIYFCVGNHDLYHRGNRQLYSTYHFNKFNNVRLVSEMLVEENMIFCPYLFKDEYPAAAALISKHEPQYVFGHFEFKNFVVTGSDRRIDHGPDHKLFTGPEYIFSGHFHKRQITDNVVYIGNTFPTNYGDAWDDARGMCVLDTADNKVKFIDWKDCPKYRKVKLSDVLGDSSLTFPEKCRVRCLIDVDIGYSEAQTLKEEIIKQLSLREFSLEENILEKRDALAGDDSDVDFDFSSLNDAVVKMLETGITGTATIDPSKLIQIYCTL
jgi:DNA repair exonuclease SbcCD nuclease subunit